MTSRWRLTLVSLFLALQLKARFEGLPTPVYALQEVHHTT